MCDVIAVRSPASAKRREAKVTLTVIGKWRFQTFEFVDETKQSSSSVFLSAYFLDALLTDHLMHSK